MSGAMTGAILQARRKLIETIGICCNRHIFVLEGPGAMLGSAVIGGFILAMIEGTGILINRYSQMFMPQPGIEGK